MTDLAVVAQEVHPDEKAWDMFCGPRNGRWVTVVRVVRADRLAEHVIDHGPEEEFSRIPPLYMPSMLEERVGLLLAYAEAHRYDLRWWKRTQELKESSTLIQDVINQEWERHLRIQNKSTFGPHQTVQRNGYNRTETRRRFKDKIAKRTGKQRFYTS